MFQEFIDGLNGVSMHDTSNKHAYLFDYAVSTKQGDIVNGKQSDASLTAAKLHELEKIGKQLSKDFRCKIQLEFVIATDGTLYIVQFRTFDKIILQHERSKEELDESIIIGKTFTSAPDSSWSRLTVDVDDILVVDEDALSEQLLGKKALIVKNDTSFSHILALSTALDIPSIYATGDFDLSAYAGKQLVIDTSRPVGIIQISK
jgi:phosphoenolpyruvate synthase/pyruvate phosphate dikinase